MPLPKIDLPIFELKLISVETPVKFRPFLVKEEKLLLMALQDQKEEEILKAIKQVINNCLVTELDIDTLPIFDIEYLFLNLRARSVGEKIEPYFVCRNVINKTVDENGIEQEEFCLHTMPVEINILDIKPPINNLSSKIYLTNDIGIQLKVPNLTSFKSINNLVITNDSKVIFDMIYDCCEYVFNDSEINYINETSREEFHGFLEALTQQQFDRITGFFEQLPTIQHDVKYSCSKCNFEHSVHLEGLSDFFT